MIRLVHKPPLTRRFTQYVNQTYGLPAQETTTEGDQTTSVSYSIMHRFEPLAFAIFFAAVNSLTQNSVFERFASEKDTLLTQFQTAIKLGLGRENFLTTSSIEVLQAFVLLLVRLKKNPFTSRASLVDLPIARR